MNTILSISALIISICALIPSFVSSKYEKRSFKHQVYERFAQMWFDMDQIFINHPDMRKYFYKSNITEDYAVLNPDDNNYELGVSIAEMFSDVFQYTAPLEDYLSDSDKASYIDYKIMILSSPIMQAMKKQYQWHK